MKHILVSNVLLKNIWVPKYQKFPHLLQLSTVIAMMKIDRHSPGTRHRLSYRVSTTTEKLQIRKVEEFLIKS